ncbi:hypothetical protein BJ138DRAFT_1106281 [Hygrophoropsis aurantiaca]|uniref:Uncharacterized protein n=1 Tax=Hygrophoropsis aurantiaca TaxID=72124 RepID=A0ACB7ZWC4_9AGAM|nr:hypothetical protein BJ138DRAFT_1106281 [Hygrophoropsis aurantiaca]
MSAMSHRTGSKQTDSFEAQTTDQRGPIVIPVMGPSGVGKSAFINTLAGHPITAVGHDLKSCTVQVQDIAIGYPKDPLQRIIFVDTPSFGSYAKSDLEVLRALCVRFSQLYSAKFRIAGIIYLHPISQTRVVGPSATKDLALMKELCGSDAYPNIVLATTRWGDIGEASGNAREKLLLDYWADLIKGGSRMAQFRGTSESAWAIVDLILERTPLRELQIQKELAAPEISLRDTHAGRFLRSLLKEVAEAHKKRVKQMRKDLRMRKLKGDDLQTSLQEVEDQLRSIEFQLAQLETSRFRRIMGKVGFHKNVSQTLITSSLLNSVRVILTQLMGEGQIGGGVPRSTPNLAVAKTRVWPFLCITRPEMHSETKENDSRCIQWEPEEGDITILLLGQSGSGKSTFINIAAGQDLATVGHDVTTCTQKITPIVVPQPCDLARRVIFIDTPGFDGTWSGDRETLKGIVDWVNKLHEEGITLAGIIYLHEITQSRNAKETSGHLMTPVKLAYPNGAKNIILVTTRWKNVESGVAELREKQLHETFWREILQQGARTHRFTDTQESAWDAVNLIRNISNASSLVNMELASILEKFPNKAKSGPTGGFFTFLFGGRLKIARSVNFQAFSK